MRGAMFGLAFVLVVGCTQDFSSFRVGDGDLQSAVEGANDAGRPPRPRPTGPRPDEMDVEPVAAPSAPQSDDDLSTEPDTTGDDDSVGQGDDDGTASPDDDLPLADDDGMDDDVAVSDDDSVLPGDDDELASDDDGPVSDDDEPTDDDVPAPGPEAEPAPVGPSPTMSVPDAGSQDGGAESIDAAPPQEPEPPPCAADCNTDRQECDVDCSRVESECVASCSGGQGQCRRQCEDQGDLCEVGCLRACDECVRAIDCAVACE
jgi:hypothetical protein